MFSNIGKKIKFLASLLCWLGIAGFVIVALIMVSVNDNFIPFAAVLIIVGPLMSWVSSFFMYGFGELIDKACDIERNTRGEIVKSPVQATVNDDRTEKLNSLRSQGLITEEEYQQAISQNDK